MGTVLMLSIQAQLEIKNRISSIIYEHGEGLLDDDGVDETVCDEVADEIVAFVTQMLSQIVLEDQHG